MPEKVAEDVGDSTGVSDSEAAGPKINESALLRKLDLRLLPAVGILYLLSFLDRSNVGNARIEGLTSDLNISTRGQSAQSELAAYLFIQLGISILQD
ncbi:hypothetical protein AAE478_001359 [Parahypoxylon ruwenzoriense]